MLDATSPLTSVQVFWPNDNDGLRVGTVVQIVSNPSIEGMQPMIRIKVENVGMAVRKSSE